jgi:hypothetical protein
MLAAAFISLSLTQGLAIMAMTVAAIALSFLLGIDEGRVRGRAQERKIRQQARDDLREASWFPGGRQ